MMIRLEIRKAQNIIADRYTECIAEEKKREGSVVLTDTGKRKEWGVRMELRGK